MFLVWRGLTILYIHNKYICVQSNVSFPIDTAAEYFNKQVHNQSELIAEKNSFETHLSVCLNENGKNTVSVYNIVNMPASNGI